MRDEHPMVLRYLSGIWYIPPGIGLIIEVVIEIIILRKAITLGRWWVLLEHMGEILSFCWSVFCPLLFLGRRYENCQDNSVYLFLTSF